MESQQHIKIYIFYGNQKYKLKQCIYKNTKIKNAKVIVNQDTVG